MIYLSLRSFYPDREEALAQKDRVRVKPLIEPDTPMTPDSSPNPSYRWLKPEHQDLLFWGIEPPLPWPTEDDKKIDPKADFPFHRLLVGIERLRAERREWDAKWEKVKVFLERGNELNEALESGELRTALRILDELETLRPGTAYCAFNRAFMLRSLGDKAGALAAAKEATQRAPKLEHIWMRCGDLHEEMQDAAHDEKAAKCYRRALTLLPNHQQALEGLARLGEMMKANEILPDGTRRTRFFTPDQFKLSMAANVAHYAPDDPQLRSMLKQFNQPNDAEVALLVIDRIMGGKPTDEAALLIQRADALRMLKRVKEAERVLKPFLLDEDENHPEAHYVQAWCHFDSGHNGEGWDCIRDTLALDPNHQKAIQAKFRIGRNNKDPQTIERLSKWAERRESWRGHWVASIQASTNNDVEAALRCAEAAYKLAPQERDALFLYANCLNNMDEGEYTAALVQPRLPEAKGDYTLKYIFAGAMKKLGLPELAIRVLRESLEEESDMPEEWRCNTQHFLDELTGMVATSEIDLEFHPNTDTLRREVWVGGDEGPQVPLLRAGVSLPQERPVRMTPRTGYTGSTGSMAMYHHGQQTELEPTSLGWFQAHEIDFSANETPMMTVTVTTRRKLEATARQGERRIPVTWTLYRVPSMENDPSTGNPK